jgi:hypothetical protein
MGTITRSFANNITTSGVLLPASLNNNSIANVTAYNASVATGGMKLISSQTASNSASISFTTGIDSTYKEYQFWFVDIHSRAGGSGGIFQFNMSTDSGSNYNVTKTTTSFSAWHDEADTDTKLGYATTGDLAQSTSYQNIGIFQIINQADSSLSGSMQLFNPSSTTYVKHFLSNVNYMNTGTPYTINDYVAGYGNTTSAVNAIQFKMDTGNFDGTILLYGIV